MLCNPLRVPAHAAIAGLAALLLVLTGCTNLGPVPTAQSAGAVELIAHEPLFARGMNAGLAVAGDYAYIGFRSDVQESHPHPGILAVDISEPSEPVVVAEFGVSTESSPGFSSRELRVWPAADLLIVLDIPCSGHLHGCVGFQPARFRFFDIAGDAAADPALVSEYIPSSEVHEFFLWQDPDEPTRALLYSSTFAETHLLVIDISAAREGQFEEMGQWAAEFPDPRADDFIHSMSVSRDGSRGYLAYLSAGYLEVDTSDFATGRSGPQIRVVTEIGSRPRWDGPGVHSVVPIPGRDLVMTTDEAYGTYARSIDGCPWGWSRIIDVADPAHPEVVGEYRVTPYNDEAECVDVPTARDERSSFSSHNPTVTENLALVTWHSAGLQIVDISDPATPSQLAAYVPEALEEVTTEDPALTSGIDNVAMWSYPIIRDGLIYVVDIRNGLYVLRYTGPHAGELTDRPFLEGNSNIDEP